MSKPWYRVALGQAEWCDTITTVEVLRHTEKSVWFEEKGRTVRKRKGGDGVQYFETMAEVDHYILNWLNGRIPFVKRMVDHYAKVLKEAQLAPREYQRWRALNPEVRKRPKL